MAHASAAGAAALLIRARAIARSGNLQRADAIMQDALKRLPATIVSSTQFLVPVVAVIIEMVLGHIPSGLVLAGMLITIAGVALVNLAPALRQPWQRSVV